MLTKDRDYITYGKRRKDGNIFHFESEEEESMGDMNGDRNELSEGKTF